MKTVIIATLLIASSLMVTSTVTSWAEVPSWVKSNAGWWADGTITDDEFISGMEFLIAEDIIKVPQITISSEMQKSVPSWVKSNAGWWADGTITDDEFTNGIEHLIKSGLVVVSTTENTMANNDDFTAFEVKLKECEKITKAYKRVDCKKAVNQEMTLYTYKSSGKHFDLGPITYYWQGIGSEGNEFEISPTGQPILTIRMLAENTSSEVTSINCTSPAICAYDVWDGTTAFKYSGMDFTSGQIVLNPGDSREFNILFGPNIGYGGTEFEYDALKTYVFRINEDFGSANIALELE